MVTLKYFLIEQSQDYIEVYFLTWYVILFYFKLTPTTVLRAIQLNFKKKIEIFLSIKTR